MIDTDRANVAGEPIDLGLRVCRRQRAARELDEGPSAAACRACSTVREVGADMPYIATMAPTPTRRPSSNINSASWADT